VDTYGCIEAGGSKFICGVGTGQGDLRLETFPTTSPVETIARAVDFFQTSGAGKLDAIGIGAFGPLDLDPDSPTFGYITSTPKPGWQNFDLAGSLVKALGAPVAIDTDVNAAALGEARWGAAKGVPDFIYLTVGTGIGGGAVIRGQVVHGLVHPEMGHVRVPHDLASDPYPGCCPYHGDCLEGLASGPAIRARWGAPPEEMPADHPAWALEARYIALGLATWVCTLSPRRVVIGGGVMRQQQLLPMIRAELRRLLNGYIQSPVLADLDSYIVPPRLAEKAGVLGAMALVKP
jgi:fructokinase